MNQNIKRIRRKNKIRKVVIGSEIRPRVSIFRSNRFLYAQAIDDTKGATLAAANSIKSTESLQKQAVTVSDDLAKKLKAKKIISIVFDRNGFKYHGAVKNLADQLRKNGINF